MPNSIEVDGMEELSDLFREMSLTEKDERKALRNGITIIANTIEKNTPRGPTEKLAEIKTGIRNTGLGMEAKAQSKAFYDAFQEFGTSQQKENIGYFENSVEDSKNEAIEEVAKVVFEKIR